MRVMFTKTGSRVGDKKCDTLQEGEEGRYLAVTFGSDQLTHLPVYYLTLTTAVLWETGNAFGETAEWKEAGNFWQRTCPTWLLMTAQHQKE
ncbi:hypothetical protein Nmel_017027 [Mimus melanotis]